MMDMISIIDASLAFGGTIAVVLLGISMLPPESTSVSTSSEKTGHHSGGTHDPIYQAAA